MTRLTPTHVSIALVGVDGQIAQVHVRALLWWPGHNKMDQTSSFTYGGDSLGVGHTCH